MDPEQAFIDMIMTAHRAHGMDELSARLVAILFLEPGEVSLEDLAKKTGYSPAAISTTMKYLENFGFLTRIKKPKSRKVYFFMEKDILQLMRLQLEKMYTHKIQPVKQHLPEIIKNYRAQVKKSKNHVQLEKLRIMEHYQQQALVFEQLIADTMRKLDHETRH